MNDAQKPIRVAILTALAFMLLGVPGRAADPISPPPKVPLAFNRLYDYPDLVAALKQLVAAHPDILTLSSLGKSVEGRDLWCVTIQNAKTGPERTKPAMYVDGNVHGNEVQAGEACLYLIWYLSEQYGRNETLTKLIDERVFYVVPTVNPDGRAYWFNGPNTTHSSRSGKAPRDDDRDGLFDEDGYEDLDGDGQVTEMRRKSPTGQWKVSPNDPRAMIQVAPGETGEYELLGAEGIDNDGDGLVNEDPPGGYDMNRNYPADWQPEPAQAGAGDYPLCWPETRAVSSFLLDHPNIAGVQAFHNFGGMILRGPGSSTRNDQYPAEDDRVAATIGATGERMLPFYKSMVIYKDLYNVHGGFVGWAYEHLGIFAFTNELWNGDQMLARPTGDRPFAGRAMGGSQPDDFFASDRLQFGATFRPWKPFHHPQYGDIEIGGFVKQSQRVPPPFMLEELCHRNAAFVIFHADQMPRVEWDDVEVKPLGAGTVQVTAGVRNTRLIPTVSRQAARHDIGLPDFLSIEGADLTVAAGGLLTNRDTGALELATHEPGRLKLESGVASESVARVRWFVRGHGTATLRYTSQKGGSLARTLDLP